MLNRLTYLDHIVHLVGLHMYKDGEVNWKHIRLLNLTQEEKIAYTVLPFMFIAAKISLS